MLKRLGSVLCCVVLLTALSAIADEWNKKTIVTFSALVELPGIVLPAGTYVFKLLDSQSNRNIVQVLNANETQVFATILAIPNYRLIPTDGTVLRFEERPSNTPEAVRAWFYPGDNFGQEFVYPKKRGAELAEAASVPVLTGALPTAPTPDAFFKEPVITITPEKNVVEVAKVTEPIQPEAAPPVLALTPPPPLEPVKELPETASPIPLLMLIGLGSLWLAGALRAVARHSA